MKKTGSLCILLCIFLISPAAHSSEPELLPSLDAEIVIRDWHVIGPFLSGPREPLTNPLSGVFHPLDPSGIPDLNARYPSTLATGRDVGWTEIQADEGGNLNIKFENVDWEKINDEWGASGIYFIGAAYATFECSSICRALADAHSIGSFVLNGVRYSGDPYGHRLIKPPVILEEGINHVLFFYGGFGGEDSVRFKLEPVPSEVMVLERDILVPDLIRGKALTGGIGIPILNTTNTWLGGIELTFEGEMVTFTQPVEVPALPPLSVIKVPAHCAVLEGQPANWEGDNVEIKITVHHPYGETEGVAKARVRNPEDSRIITFFSDNDYSVQKLAVRYPLDYDAKKRYALILTLHGAGVECQGLVDAYQSKDWAFVVAPTNRRRFGFDWQDWGRLDALEVLDYCLQNFPIDPNRVYLVGHSMGGHGTWHVGCTHADKFAAIVPSAGWASFQLYIPWFLRCDEMYADPDCKRIFDATQSPDRTELMLPNLRNTPVFAVHGSEDDNVPPTHARLLTGMLESMGYYAAYWEEPGQGHWWDMSPDIPGADCVDHEKIMNFLRLNERDEFPREVTFVTYDMGNNSGNFWVRVDEEIDPTAKVEVDAEIRRRELLVCDTYNVRQLTLTFQEGGWYPGEIVIDGQLVGVPPGGGLSITLAGGDTPWRTGKVWHAGVRKTADFRGPIKRAYFEPFTIVTGTSGDETQNALNMELARNIAQRWWYRANGYVRIVNDSDITREEINQYNLILIGGPDSNSISRRLHGDMPIRMDNYGVWLGDEYIHGDDIAVKFIYPNPLNPDKLVLCNWGTSLEGMRLAGGLTCLYSGSGLPDFLIYDEQVKLTGYAGVRAAGFFDNDWRLDPDLYYLNK